ncbi:MAG: hypothetical protein Q4F43_01985 [Eubacteriales bacterium]|nr:hypothetical protein [Eubacteriales bacterium]
MIPGAYENFILEVSVHFDTMCEENPALFVTDVDCGELWDLYLNSIPPKENPMFRNRREYDCSTCRQFVMRGGNVVAIRDGKLTSVWDVEVPDFFGDVVKRLSAFVKQAPVSNIFLSPFQKIGVEKNYEYLGDRTVITWEHLYAVVPKKYVDSLNRESRMAEARSKKEVFQRGLEELTIESIDVVLDLISQNSLYRGQEWKSALEKFRALKCRYDALPAGTERDLFAWEHSAQTDSSVARIRSHSMGTLLTDISEGMDLEEAVTRWEKIMAPYNYKRPKAIFTQKMLDDAKETIIQLGYMESLPRRFASLNDISVNNILFANRDAARRIPGAAKADDFFSDLEKHVVSSPKQFSKVQEIGIEDFVQKVLPSARNLEVYFENRHAGNLVSLIAPVNREAPSLFKWDNGFSWAYTGNIADSRLKERVKAAGGRVDGVLRFSIQWNDGDGKNKNDEDAHCVEPDGYHIYYRQKTHSRTKGALDVDIMDPNGKVAVENITWPSREYMLPGTYKFYVHTFAGRGGRGGFRAEVEADGETHTYDYQQDTIHKKSIYVADVLLDKDGKFTIQDKLPSGISANSKTAWGINTNQFVPVSVVCYSPNWWDEQTGNGNRHYFFMLRDCVNDESPNGFFNEQLKQELLGPHKRVLEALGAKTKVQDTPDQLSGLGFSSTRPASLVVRVTGATERLLKIRF